MTKKLYIIQMHSNTFPSKIVKLVTKYNYSHVGISLDKKCDIIYTFGRKDVNNFLNGGFIIERKDGDFFKKFNKTKCRIYEIDVSYKTYNDVKKHILEFINNKDMYKYDFVGVVLRTFGIPISFKNHYVCSQFVAEILDKNNIYKFNKKICFVIPKDFDKIECKKEIYVGNYLSYKCR